MEVTADMELSETHSIVLNGDEDLVLADLYIHTVCDSVELIMWSTGRRIVQFK